MSKESVRKDAGLVVKEIRKRLGMSQKEFADKIGTSQTYLSSIEKGTFPPDKFVKKVSETFNFPPEAIAFLSLSEEDVVADKKPVFNVLKKSLEESIYTLYLSPEDQEI